MIFHKADYASIAKNYTGPRSLLIAAGAIDAYDRGGGLNVYFKIVGGTMLALLGSTLFVCGKGGARADREVNRMIGSPLVSAVLSDRTFGGAGLSAREMSEMRYAGSSAPAAPSSNIIPALAVMSEVFPVPADRLCAEYLRRVSAGVSAVYSAHLGERTIAAAAADYICGGDAVIGSVSVLPEYRGKRAGMELAASAAAGYSNAYIVCAQSMERPYSEAGFKKTAALYLTAKEKI